MLNFNIPVLVSWLPGSFSSFSSLLPGIRLRRSHLVSPSDVTIVTPENRAAEGMVFNSQRFWLKTSQRVSHHNEILSEINNILFNSARFGRDGTS